MSNYPRTPFWQTSLRRPPQEKLIFGINHEDSHMPESPSTPPDSTFVVRFRREWSAAEPRWRGRVEHVQSGESVAFLDLDEMLSFFRRFGAMANDENHFLRDRS